jgi:transposase
MERIDRPSPKHQFTIRERLAILAEYEACVEIGEKSVLLRRLGVSQSSVSRWAIEKRAGLLLPKDGKQNKYMMSHRDRVDYERVKRENEALKAKLAQSESVVEVLGKASALLEALAKSAALNSQLPAEPEQTIPPAFTRPKSPPSSEHS